MSDFYISKLSVNGTGKEPAIVEFNPGLNLVVGPSNSGKSLIIDCIDYVFGYQHKGAKQDKHYRLDGMKTKYGYDTINLQIITPKGMIQLTRELRNSGIFVSSTDPDYESGKYSASHSTKRSINRLLLKLIGIDDRVDILSSVKGKTQQLTWRAFLYTFLIRQSFVARETSLLISPTAETTSVTSGPAALLYLLTGQDASFVDKNVDLDKSVKSTGIIEYIEQKLNDLEEEKKKIPEDLASYQDIMDSSVSQAATFFHERVEDSSQITQKIQEIDGQLSEQFVMRSQFDALRSQYQTDIDRMTFIVEGELALKNTPPVHSCPFCGSQFTPEDEPSYIESVRANLSHVRRHLTELEKADADVGAKITELQNKREELQRKLLNAQMFHADEAGAQFLNKLNTYSRLLRTSRTKEQIEAEQEAYRTDLLQHQREKDATEPSYHIQDYYPNEIIKALEDRIISILKDVRFPSAGTAHYNLDTWDIDFGPVNKASIMGGGYCGIVNTVYALALKDLLAENGCHAPKMALVDSPLTALSESSLIKDKDTIREGFISYLLKNKDHGQVIIAEHKDRMPGFVDELCPDFKDYHAENFSIIQFSHSLEHGRSGLFPGVADEGN